MGAETGSQNHMLHLFPKRMFRRVPGHGFDQLQKAGQWRSSSGRQRRVAAQSFGRLPEGAALGAGNVADQVDCLGANSTYGRIDDALERWIVVAVGDQAEIGERVFDFRTFEE